MGISMFTRLSQAGKSTAVRVHPYSTFTLGSSWVLSGSVRFPFDGCLNVYEAEPSGHLSSSQGYQ